MTRLRFLRAASGQAPVTWTLAALSWLLFAIFRPGGNLHLLSLGDPVTPLQVFSSGLTFVSIPSGVVCTALALTGASYTEKKLGSTWYAAIILLIQAVGGAFGAFIAWVVVDPSTAWGEGLHGQEVLTPLTWILGAAAMGSARFAVLWRRRVRTVLLVGVVTVVLYSGTLTQLCVAVSTLVGCGLGIVLWNRPVSLRPRAVSVSEGRVLVGLTVAAIGLGPLFAALSPYSVGLLSGIARLTRVAWWDSSCAEGICQPEEATNTLAMAILPAIIVVILVIGLTRGRRLAWWGSLAAFAVTLPIVVLETDRYLSVPEGEAWFYGLSVTSVAVPWLVGLAVLVLTGRLFTVRGGELRFVQVAGFGTIAAALTWFLLGEGWGFLPFVYLPPMIREIVLGTTPSWRFLVSSTLFWVLFAVGLWWALHTPPRVAGRESRDRAVAFLDAGLGDHLSHMTLWPGNEYFFTEDGYVAYQVHNLVAVTVGSPVSSTPTRLADAFEDHCARLGLTCAWYSVPTSFAESRSGQRVQVAEESVIDVTDVSFKGKKFQDVRTATNRAVKEHIRSVWTTWAALDTVTRERIRALSEEWVAEKALPEMGFTLGGLESLDDERVRLMIAVDESGHVHGVTSWLPAAGGWVLDFMRRDREGFRPVVEFLIAETARRAHEDGLTWISLSGAPLAHSTSGEPTAVDNLLSRLGEILEPWYGFRSLAAFKKKFQPSHEAWWLCYKDVADLPTIGLAVSACYVDVVDVAKGAFLRK
ncbi:DUF2156 domain-containing protein [Corynebacterium pyruviciproducens]|uniref:bifunctional lysylphosphatidylglycerol flippase/synthetase MprF n=1 Tax=Corynebacterium pyruviciproducens TaxID=598660 RepID=UPI00254EF392|nr:DUF2156 domain-containing protein [Corynebacterium pyruviciproducens]MDK6564855.1 DUF2156 domain-containing protein [Corynebacterium pyruviciproducens]